MGIAGANTTGELSCLPLWVRYQEKDFNPQLAFQTLRQCHEPVNKVKQLDDSLTGQSFGVKTSDKSQFAFKPPALYRCKNISSAYDAAINFWAIVQASTKIVLSTVPSFLIILRLSRLRI
jgi:hypothetical protein